MSHTLYDVSWATGLIERSDFAGRTVDYDDPEAAWLSKDVKDWCDQSLKQTGEVFVTYERWHNKDGHDTYYPIGNIHFEYDEDYILFKMRWLDP